jgi:hypothetical protein
VLRVSGGEDDEGLMLRPAHYIGTDISRHLDVEKYELRFESIDHLDRALSVRGFTDN